MSEKQPSASKISFGYNLAYSLVWVLFNLLYRIRITGKENIPENASLICANHSALTDPFYIALAYGKKRQLRIVAKAELFRIPVLSSFLRGLGMISVDRDAADVKSVKAILRCLKAGDTVALFPEGTRSRHDFEVPAKHGAVKLAEHANVPIVPMNIPRRKPLFGKINITIGQMYHISKQKEKRTSEEYTELADIMMKKINMLNPKAKVTT